MWRNVAKGSTTRTQETETRGEGQEIRQSRNGDQERAGQVQGKGQEMRMVPRMHHGAALPDVGRPSGFLSSKPDIAPVAELVTEAEEYVRASDPLMAGMGDGNGAPWVPEKFVDDPHTGSSFDNFLEEEGIKDEVTQVALASILEQRGSRYGRFEDNAGISQGLKIVMRARDTQLAPDQWEALDQIAAKISRILVGDPDYADNWDDIAGFATLVANRLRGK